jgi:hypothetical protein
VLDGYISDFIAVDYTPTNSRDVLPAQEQIKNTAKVSVPEV